MTSTTTSPATLADLSGSYVLDPTHTRIGFVARHAMITKVRGQFNEFEGAAHIDTANPSASSAKVNIRAASITTGQADRDAHLRSEDFLNVERHPQLTYRSHAVEPAGTDRWTVHGWLAMHGVVRDVSLSLTYLGYGPDPWGGLRAAFRATAELKREEFAMNYNQILAAGIAAIGTTLRIELDVQAVQGEELPALE